VRGFDSVDMRYQISNIQNTFRPVAGLVIFAFAISVITSCAQATDSELTAVVEQARQLPPTTTEATPVTANSSQDSSSIDTVEPTLGPAATLTPIEAESNSVTPLPGRSDSGVQEPEIATPNPISNSDTPNTVPADHKPDPTPSGSPTVAPTPLSPVASSPTIAPPTIAPAAEPTPTPEPTATEIAPLAPTPRPTPGPISRQTQFIPLDEPAYVTRDEASQNITSASYVLGIANNGEARAYPLDMMWYHHIANDTVGGEPWLVTY
jgi:hypothetical protein